VGQVGCGGCDGPTQFAEIYDVAVDERGNLLVLGNEAPMLRMSDGSGRVLWTAGTDGMGPGEYRRPLRAIPGPAVVQVLDMTQRRVTRLHVDGGYGSSARVAGFPAAVAAQGRSGTFMPRHRRSARRCPLTRNSSHTFAIDGMRYDDTGRLWVRTMRGDQHTTVFDVFTPAGAFAGEVRLDALVGSYSLAGRFMAASVVTNEDFAAVWVFEVR
jgi:hypothetical protein